MYMFCISKYVFDPSHFTRLQNCITGMLFV